MKMNGLLALGRAIMFAVVLCFCSTSFAQKQDVKGVVVDVNGIPLVGVSIMEKGTTNGVVSDLDGNFKMKAADNGVLVVSYLGYSTREVVAKAGKTLQIVLKENTELLDEVVVVGYGTCSRTA